MKNRYAKYHNRYYQNGKNKNVKHYSGNEIWEHKGMLNILLWHCYLHAPILFMPHL